MGSSSDEGAGDRQSGVPQGSILGPFIFKLCNSRVYNSCTKRKKSYYVNYLRNQSF